MTAPHVVGLDLSLTGTGYAAIYGSVPTTHTETIGGKGRDGADLTERYIRLEALRSRIWAADGHGITGAQLVVVEGPSTGGKAMGHAHDRSGLWWLVMTALLDRGIRVAAVPPSSLKKYATGRGNAAKDQVLAAAVKRYPGIDVTGNDVADAVVLAAMGRRYLGFAIEASLPAGHRDAISGVQWPESS